MAEHEQLTLARLLVAEGEAREALGLLDRVLDDERAAGRDGSLVEAWLVRALAHHSNGDADAAAADLAAALIAGVPAGYCRLFLDEGGPMAELLERVGRAAAADVWTHAEQLLAAAARPLATAPAGRACEEGLSERERQVLRLLATELSGPEIARELLVSVNTLRTHTKHIFRPLDVKTRRAVVEPRTSACSEPHPGAITTPESHQVVCAHHIDSKRAGQIAGRLARHRNKGSQT